MAERVYEWSTGIALGFAVVLAVVVIANVGSPVGEIFGGFIFVAFLTSFVSWKMMGEPGRDDSTTFIQPGGGLALALTAGAALFLATPSTARAEVDCWWSEIECRAGMECGWDAQRHSHRCMPMLAETNLPLVTSQCAMQDDAECPTDYPHMYRACLRDVAAHNAACAAQQAACEDTKEVARIACMPEEHGGTFDRRIPESVAACGRARNSATAGCPAPAPVVPTQRQRPVPDAIRCSIRIGGHSTCPP